MNKIKVRIQNIMIRKPDFVPLYRILPSLVTLSSIAAGMTSILFAIKGEFDHAVIAIVLAAVFDSFDGRLARFLKSSSQFGVELDSLADSISFGVAPAFIMFFYSTHNVKNFGWIVSVLFAISCILRLARYNVATTAEIPEYWSYFFTGVPAPAGALLTLIPIMLFYTFKDSLYTNKIICIVWMILVAFMMISRIPTLSLKKMKIANANIAHLLLVLILFLGLIYFYFWPVISIIWVGYFLTIPISIVRFLKMKKYCEKLNEKSI